MFKISSFMKFAYLTLFCLLSSTLSGCIFRYNAQTRMEDKQLDNNINNRDKISNYVKEESRESEVRLLTLTKIDEYGYTSKFEYIYNSDSCILKVKPTPECSHYYKNMMKYKIIPHISIEYIDYRNCTMRLTIKEGLITQISEEWEKGNTWPVHYDEDKHMVELYNKEADWDKDKLNQVKTSINYGPSVNDWVSYNIVQYGNNIVKSSPDLLKEMFYINETEIVFVYIGLYGKLPNTTSRYTIDTYQKDAYIYTTTWSNRGSHQVVKKQKVGSEKYSEICYDWEINNLDWFKALFK